jgi:hypothetical protein
MHNTRYGVHHLGPLIVAGLLLVSLVGGLTFPTVVVAHGEPATYRGRRDGWDQRRHWGQREYWGHWHGRPYRQPEYGLPDRYTIHKGKKCQLRCQRIWGTNDYRCREYRC